MLCLSRKEGQEIIVTGPAKLIIDKIKGNRVQVLVDAEKTTTVLRGELEPREKPREGAA